MIILAVFIIVAFIVGIVYTFTDKDRSIFDYSTVEQIYKDENKRSVDDSFKFSGIKEFGYVRRIEKD